MTQKIVKLAGALAIVLFLLLSTFCELLDAISYATSLSMLFCLVYDRWLWKYNPFEKTPRIAGIYQADCCSNYNGEYRYSSRITIHQTLSTITVCEQLMHKQGYCESITASLIPPIGAGKWRLYYTYVTRQKAMPKDAMHEGTVILDIMDQNTLSGTYFTNRMEQTAGDMELIRIPR